MNSSNDIFTHALEEWEKEVALSVDESGVVSSFIAFAHDYYQKNQPISQEAMHHGLALRFQDGAVLTLSPLAEDSVTTASVSITAGKLGGVVDSPSQKITEGE